MIDLQKQLLCWIFSLYTKKTFFIASLDVGADDDEMREKSSKQFLCDGTLCERGKKEIVFFL